jgi:hypothetical protein
MKRDWGEESAQEYSFEMQWWGQGPSGTDDCAAQFDDTEPAGGFTDTNGDAIESTLYLYLCPGSWTLGVSSEGWSAQCEQTLSGGQNQPVNFTYGTSGCATGPLPTDFP